MQLIPREIDLPWDDVTAGPDELAGVLADDHARRFDPARPPLLRFTLVRLGSGEYRLLVTNHHILLDGWSMPMLVRELFTLYEGERVLPPAAAVPRLPGLAARPGPRRRRRTGLAPGAGRGAGPP